MSNEEEHQNTGDSNCHNFDFEGDSFPSNNEDATSSSFEKREESPRGEFEEDGVKEDFGRNNQSKNQKRIRSAQLHKHNERLRRLRLKAKMKALQELIPHCSKRDKISTFDDAIKYIKTLQHQVKVMAMGTGYFTSNQPQTVTPSPAPLLQTYTPGIGTLDENGMKMEKPASLEYFPMNHDGFPDPYLMPSLATLRLPAPDGSSAIQSPLDFAPSGVGTTLLWPTSLESHGSRSMTCPSSQGHTSEQSSARREPTARVLPSKIVQPYHSEEE